MTAAAAATKTFSGIGMVGLGIAMILLKPIGIDLADYCIGVSACALGVRLWC